jgi:uncharacterized caspase-like protein
MRLLPCLAVTLAVVFLAAPSFAQQTANAGATTSEKRLALVIGNSAYGESPLRNPANDARAMAQVLRSKGFGVILHVDATRSQLTDAIAEFGERLGEGSIALFFYAGHGMQLNGHNYLIPVDAKLGSEQRVKLETIDMDVVLDQMQAAHARVSMVILDACRNNPFERRFRSAAGGLAQLAAPEGTLIGYATSPGKVAGDGDGANGLYTAELLRAMAEPGIRVEDVFKRVRVAVSRKSNGGQIPWEASSLVGDFYFDTPAGAAPATPTTAKDAAPPAVPAVAPAAAPPPAAVSLPAVADREALFWDAIRGSADPRDFQAYLDQFPSGTFAAIARNRLTPRSMPLSAAAAAAPASPSAQAVAAVTPPPPAAAPAPPVAAEPAAPPSRATPVSKPARRSAAAGSTANAAAASRQGPKQPLTAALPLTVPMVRGWSGPAKPEAWSGYSPSDCKAMSIDLTAVGDRARGTIILPQGYTVEFVSLVDADGRLVEPTPLSRWPIRLGGRMDRVTFHFGSGGGPHEDYCVGHFEMFRKNIG